MRKFILATTFILSAGIFPAMANDVQMLPPTDPTNLGNPCSMGLTNSNQMLIFNGNPTAGQSAINCNTKFTADPSTGAVNIDGNIKIGDTAAPNSSLDLSTKTDAISMPRGTTAQQPANPALGMTRYNTDTNRLEYWNGTAWTNIDSGASCTASYSQSYFVSGCTSSSYDPCMMSGIPTGDITHNTVISTRGIGDYCGSIGGTVYANYIYQCQNGTWVNIARFSDACPSVSNTD